MSSLKSHAWDCPSSHCAIKKMTTTYGFDYLKKCNISEQNDLFALKVNLPFSNYFNLELINSLF